MKQLFIIAAAVLFAVAVTAQRSSYIRLAGFTTQTAMPFAKFSGLFKEVLHPGVEIGVGKILRQKLKHDWFAEIRLAYFYHRFVQHGLPLYLTTGYRHTIYKGFAADASIGAGYMQAIPATAKFKLNSDGDYVKNTGAGRMQAIATFGIGLSYKTAGAISVFANYQQRIQFPFVKSYVPLLPYNSFFIGISKPLHHH